MTLVDPGVHADSIVHPEPTLTLLVPGLTLTPVDPGLTLTLLVPGLTMTGGSRVNPDSI